MILHRNINSKKHLDESTSDEELMIAYVDCNTRAFEILFTRWKNRVWKYVTKKIFASGDREDVVQKIFLKLHSSKHLYRREFLFAQWIYTICHTVVMDHLRSLKSKNNLLSRVSNEFEKNANIENEEVVQFDEISFQNEKLSTLSAEQIMAINLRYKEEKEFSEIAAIINKSESNVRKIISRAISKLRKLSLLERA